MKKEFLGIIIARKGSKRLPGKNIKNLCGKPLIAWTIDAAKKSKYLTRFIVSTDGKEIAKIAKGNGAEVPFIRPSELAQDNSSAECVVKHALDFLKEKENYVPEFFCLLQTTSPLRKGKHIDEAYELLQKANGDYCISVRKLQYHPFYSICINDDGTYTYYTKGASRKFIYGLPKKDIYQLNGSIYIMKTETFLKKNILEGDKNVAYIMSEEESADVDTANDFFIAEQRIKQILEKSQRAT